MDFYEFKGRLVYSKFQASQSYIVRSYLKQSKNIFCRCIHSYMHMWEPMLEEVRGPPQLLSAF